MQRVLRRIGFKARLLVTNDALIALVAAVGHAPGIVIIAGTGSIAYGRNARDEAARAGGWGYVLGDEGSGYWIGRHALPRWSASRTAADTRPRSRRRARALRRLEARRAVRAIYEGASGPRRSPPWRTQSRRRPTTTTSWRCRC